MVFTPGETAQSGLHFKSSASHHFTRLWQGRVLYQRQRTMAGTLPTVWKCLWRQVCETTLDSLPAPPAPVSGCMENVSSVFQLLGWNLQHPRPPPTRLRFLPIFTGFLRLWGISEGPLLVWPTAQSCHKVNHNRIGEPANFIGKKGNKNTNLMNLSPQPELWRPTKCCCGHVNTETRRPPLWSW